MLQAAFVTDGLETVFHADAATDFFVVIAATKVIGFGFDAEVAGNVALDTKLQLTCAAFVFQI